jgi:hypothetical protein
MVTDDDLTEIQLLRSKLKDIGSIINGKHSSQSKVKAISPIIKEID